LLYLGEFNDQPLDKLEQEFQNLGVWDSSNKEEGDFKNKLVRYSQAFYRGSPPRYRIFLKIYETLEGLRTLAEK